MANNPEPVVLELAPLPREQIGPFLLLGIEKDADLETVEEAWAKRLKQARRQQLDLGLEDINWAREVLKDPDKRLRADAGSLNVDTTERVLRKLAERFGPQASRAAAWQPRDCEKDLRDYTPAVEPPDPQAVRAAIAVPMPAKEIPAVARLLAESARAASQLDPWKITLRKEAAEEPAR
jgi:curved DNA-binding protein CbpA